MKKKPGRKATPGLEKKQRINICLSPAAISQLRDIVGPGGSASGWIEKKIWEAAKKHLVSFDDRA